MDNAPSLELVEPVGASAAAEASGSGADRSLRGRVAAVLFRSTPARTGSPWRSVLFSVVFVAAATVASLLRQSGVSAVNSMWAEDGQVFYQAVFHQSYFGALFTADNGYLDLVPRLFIGVLGHVPVAYAAETFAVSGAIVSSLIALLIYYATAGYVPSRALRLCMAVPTAVIIYGQFEVGNSIVNIQWYLNFASFWMLLWKPRTVWGRAIAAVVMIAAIGSDPIAIAFLPLLVVRLWAVPWRESLWQIGGVLAGLAYQAVAVLQGDVAKRPQIPRYDLSTAGSGYRDRVLGVSFASPHELSFIGLGTSHEALFASLLALLVVGVLGARLARPQWLMAGVCAAFSVGFYFVLAMQGGTISPRYSVAPLLLLIDAAVFLASPPARGLARSTDGEPEDGEDSAGAETTGPSAMGAPSRGFGGFGRFGWLGRATLVPTTVLCVVIGLNFAASYYGGSSMRGQSPSWSSQVHAGQEACLHAGVHEAMLSNAPGGDYWRFPVPCSALLRS